jgi:hypothetical protein
MICLQRSSGWRSVELLNVVETSYDVITMVLGFAVMLLAYNLAGIAGKAPRGWYYIVAGAALVPFRSTVLLISLFTVGNLSTDLNYLGDFFGIGFGVLAVVGLYYLNLDFSRAMRSIDLRSLTGTAE